MHKDLSDLGRPLTTSTLWELGFEQRKPMASQAKPSFRHVVRFASQDDMLKACVALTSDGGNVPAPISVGIHAFGKAAEELDNAA